MNLQKTNTRRWSLLLLSVGALLLVAYFVRRTSSQAKIASLVRPGIHLDISYEPEKEAARKERAWQLYRLWLVRDQRDVTAEIMPFAQDEYRPLRENAVRMLGRLEKPQATALLLAIQTAEQKRKTDQKTASQQTLILERKSALTNKGKQKTQVENTLRPVSLDLLQLAQGRIAARELKGKAKVEAVTKNLGLNWGEVVELTAKVTSARSDAMGTTGEKIVEEVVDILYEMGQDSEDIKPLAEQLTLYPAQKVLLEGATLSKQQQAALYVDYLRQLDVGTTQDISLAQNYLSDLGTVASDTILQQLKAAKEGQVQFGRRGYVLLFFVPAQMQDERAIPLLKYFAGKPEQPLSGYANMALENFEFMGQWASPRCPWPPIVMRD